ncbi:MULTISPECIES: sodium:solute symporter family protein [Oceanobacillus]|uniref:sodium:solute symporter family protein n=1 Tax=Oceanobacillus TaxID=182709 RepID=UPI00062110FE|nr:sodium:solute symporter family protein [Oceanobacillus caeni]KKE79890.1 pantothenate permease [Bacilli bacterium VT-13-104]PZD84116.1 sodium:solute symporter family protein [Bacilli bacterium]MED4475506.1 sodium:solute symporter family protein [Oceanobacillus caeni]PZD85477.1 sodium:solute symporter family protein [Bacilli bacterium]PZD88251.1 sodium:solute symporter family protein [Bacilli bacterium]
MSTTLVWSAIVIYVAVAILIALLSRSGKQNNMNSYFLGDRKMNGFVSALSYSATTYSAFMLVGLAGLTYNGGVGALGFELIYLMGVSLVAFFGPRFWKVGKKFGYVTPSEMLGDRYDSKTVAILVAVSNCIFLIPYSAVQLSGVGYLLQGVTNNAISFSTGVILATALAIFFTYIAGIRSVAWTDSLQALFMIITSTIVVLVLIKGLGGFSGFFGTLETKYPEYLTVPGNGFFSFLNFLGLSLPWFFFSLSNPQVSQRLYMPSSLKSMRHMLMGFLIFGLIYTIVAIIWGYSALIMFPNLENADMATPLVLQSDLIPPILGAIVMVGIMAAAISTIDSILLTLSSLFARDVYGNVKKNTSDSAQLKVGKFIIPVIAALAFIFSLMEVNLIAVLSVSSSAGLLVVVPAIIGAFFWKRGTAAGVISSVVVSGFIVIILELMQIKPLGLASGLWGILISTILFISVSLLTKAPEEKAKGFLSV